jgi:hypothetical protein
MPLCLSGADPTFYKTKALNTDLIQNYQIKYAFPQTSPNFISDGTPLNDSFSSVLDGAPVVRTYNDFVVNAGHTVTTSNRCKGLYLNILGNLVVNGKLSMTARGASCPGQHVIIDKDYRLIYYTSALESGFDYSQFTLINKDGGLGAAPYIANPNPIIDSRGACGAGGGTGGKEGTTAFLTTRGGNGTSFSGGAGAGGGCLWHVDGSSIITYGCGSVGSDNGGAGGAGAYSGYATPSVGGGGGAGNPGGICKQTSRNGSSGAGGLMIIFVHGNIIIGPYGSIEANGSKGGAGLVGVPGVSHPSYPGGGSGGGAIYLFNRGSINDQSRITVTGGEYGEKILDSTKLCCAGSNGTLKILPF